MSVFDREVHTVSVVKPTRSRSASTGKSSIDYDTPVSTRDVVGFLSTSGGTVDRGGEGEVIGFDAIWFTKDTTIEVDDQVVVDLEGLSDNFLVTGTEPKYDIDGDFDHNEVLLSKDNKR